MHRPENTPVAALIRRPSPADASRLAEIHVTTWQAAYRGIIPDHILDTLSYDGRLAMWRQALSDPDSPIETWVIEAGGVVRGFASISPCRDEDVDATRVGELIALYVDSTDWGTGLGRQLMARAIEALRERGYETMTLWVLRHNRRARAFYEAAGLRPDGVEQMKPHRDVLLDEVRYRMGL